MARRENQPGQIGSSGGSNLRCQRRKRRRRRRMIRHQLPQSRHRMNIQSRSPRTRTPVTWATESAITNLLLETSLWRWGLKPWTRTLCSALTRLSNLTSALPRTPFPLVIPAAEERLHFTTGARVSCGCVERRAGCTADLYRARGLHVLHVGLGRSVQGARTDED